MLFLSFSCSDSILFEKKDQMNPLQTFRLCHILEGNKILFQVSLFTRKNNLLFLCNLIILILMNIQVESHQNEI